MRLSADLKLAGRALWPGIFSRSFPYKLIFVATERCNLRCRLCRIWEGGSDGMAMEEVREFFSRSNRFSWIDVTGGEIFLREDLLDLFSVILRECRSLALLHFPTNGYLVDRIVETTRALVRMKPPRLTVTVSVDGPPEVHDAMRGVEGSFDRAVESYARLREIPGCAPCIGMTLSTSNLGKVRETLAAVRRRIPRVTEGDLHVNLPHRSDHYYRNGDALHPTAEALAAEVRSLRGEYGGSLSPLSLLERRLLHLGERFLRTGRTPIPCRALRTTCFLGADGTVHPCVTWSRPLGTLAGCGYDLGKLWIDPRVEAVREEIDAGRCPQCWTACESVPSLAARWGTLLP